MMAKRPSTAQMSRTPSRESHPAAWFAAGRGPVEDAEFETIVPVSPRRKFPFPVIAQKPPASRQFLSETRPASEWPGFGYWVLVALCATTAFWIAGGYTLLADKPASGGQSMLPLVSALQLTDLKTNMRENSDILSVGGRIQNTTSEERPMASGETMLKPGESIDFETMLPALRGTIEKVDVRLADRA